MLLIAAAIALVTVESQLPHALFIRTTLHFCLFSDW